MKRGWGVGILLLCANGAYAQSRGGEGLSLGASVESSYDSNVRRGFNQANSGDNDDFIIEPTVNVGYGRALGVGRVSFGGSLGYKFYQRFDNLNSERISVDGSGSTTLGPCALSTTGSFTRRQSDLQDIAVLDTNNVQNNTTVGGSIGCGAAVGLRPSFTYNHEAVTNSNSRFGQGNSTADSYTVALNYQRPALGVLSLYGTYRSGRYPNRGQIADPAVLTRDIAVYSGGASFRRDIGSMLTGSVSIGFMKVNPQGTAGGNFSGLNYSGAIAYTNGNNLGMNLSFSRGARQPNTRIASYSIDTEFSGNVRYALSRNLSLNAAASHMKRSFQYTGGGLVNPLSLNRDRTTQFSAGASLTTNRRLRFSLNGQHIDRSSDQSIFNYKSNRISLTASMSL